MTQTLKIKIQSLLTKGLETPYLEYKREWYTLLGNDNCVKMSQSQIGELIKDILALANSNSSSFNKSRYLVFGWDEQTQSAYDFGLNQSNFAYLKSQISAHIKTYITPILNKVDFQIISINQKQLLVIEIKQHPYLLSLQKDIRDNKNNLYKAHTIFTRGLNKTDEISIMPRQEILHIESLMEQQFPENFLPKYTKSSKSIKASIDAYLSINSSYKLCTNFNYKAIDNQYEIYKLIHDLTNDEIFFIYINELSSQKSTFEAINKQIPNLHHHNKDKVFILTDKPKDINFETRLANLKRTSGYSNVDYIDNFGRKHLYPKYLENMQFAKYDETIFIKSYATHMEEEGFALDFLKQWYDSEEKPIISVIGTGGIGKTTLVKGFLNRQFTHDNSYVLFIDAPTLINELKGKYIYDLYDIYKASNIYDNDNEYFPSELFKLSIDNGSLTIVLDGLDEIISGMGDQFDLSEFINNIVTDYCFNLKKAKIIITCRDSIYDNTHLDQNLVQEITLKAFDDQQAEEFFDKFFASTPQKSKAFGIAKQFKTTNSIDTISYSPFILDTIALLVKENETEDFSSFNTGHSTPEEKKLCLQNNSPNDYLIFKVCEREIRKLRDITITEQMKIFCYLSFSNEVISTLDFDKKITEIIGVNKYTESVKYVLLSHPFLLKKQNDKISFRYDFFYQFFINLYCAQIIQNNLTDDIFNFQEKFFEILILRSGYQNDFSKELSKRISVTKDDITMFCFEILEKIQVKYHDNLEYKYKILSSLFLTYLTILKSINNLENNEDIHEALLCFFGTKNNILNNLSLINIDASKKPRLLFNFENLRITNAFISNYLDFSYCNFNDHSSFENSTILYGKIKKPTSINFKSSNFINCTTDSSFDEIIQGQEINNLNKLEKNKSKLIKFLTLFRASGRFQPKKQQYIKAKDGELAIKLFQMEIIINHNESKLNIPEYIINPIYRVELYKFIDQGSASNIANQTIKQL